MDLSSGKQSNDVAMEELQEAKDPAPTTANWLDSRRGADPPATRLADPTNAEEESIDAGVAFQNMPVHEPQEDLVKRRSNERHIAREEIPLPRHGRRNPKKGIEDQAPVPNQTTRDTVAAIRNSRQKRCRSNHEENEEKETMGDDGIEEGVGAFHQETPTPFLASRQIDLPSTPAVETTTRLEANRDILAIATVVDEDIEGQDQEAIYNRCLIKLVLILVCFLVVGIVAGFLIAGQVNGDSTAPVDTGAEEREEVPVSLEHVPSLQPTISPTTGAPTQAPIIAGPFTVDAFDQIYTSDTTRIDEWQEQWTGTISSQLGLLTALTFLSFVSSELTGPIPSQLGQLTALNYLNFRTNQLTGPIPSQLGLLTALTRLWLFENLLTDPIPSELGQLVAATDLQLHNNQLSGPIPSELGKLTALTTLQLYGNRLDGSIPSELRRMTVLREIRLYDNQFEGSIPSGICNIASLISLRTDCVPDPFPLNCTCGPQCKCDNE